MTRDRVDILLVEDDPQDAELTLRALKQQDLGSRILLLRDGAEALDFLFRSGAHVDQPVDDLPKVILLDLKLPKVDGLEVLRQIRSHNRTKMTPVVVLTSSREVRDVTESYRLGVNSYVVKPVDFHQFMKCVGELSLYWLACNQPPYTTSNTRG